MEKVEINTARVREVVEDPDSLDQCTYEWFVENLKPFVRRLLYSTKLDSLHQATGVLDEALLKTIDHFKRKPLSGRDHFRRTLCMSARQAVLSLCEYEITQKRGAKAEHVTFDEARDLLARDENEEREENEELVEIYDTIDWIARKSDAMQQETALLIDHFLMEMTLKECAEAHGLSVSTVQRKLRAVLVVLRDEVRRRRERP